MNVLLVNGSPHEHGCTDTALNEIGKVLESEGVGVSHFWIGNQPIGGCVACKGCYETGKCAFGGVVNDFAEAAAQYDGFVFGSPVHYAALSGNMTAFLDRVFYSAPKSLFRGKAAAVLVSARRAGTTAAFEQLLKYPTYSEMYLACGSYWPMVHGSCPSDVLKDEEGVRTMRVMAHNLAYLLKCLEAGKKAGVPAPLPEPPARTNFIR